MMVLQEKDYIKKQKSKYLKGTIFWSISILVVFGLGIVIMQSRESYFTVFAGILVIGAALNLTRWIGYGKYKDGNSTYAELLEKMKGSFNVFHSCIIPYTGSTAYFEHIIITSRSVYFITYNEEQQKRNRLSIENKLQSKGISMKQVHVVVVKNLIEMKNLILKIEKDACYTSNHQEEYTTIINEMLM